jgi:hypothetical protein
MNRPAVASYLPFIDELTKELISTLWKKSESGAVAFGKFPWSNTLLLPVSDTHALLL